MIDVRHWSDVRDRDWRWQHFSPYELRSRGNGALKIRVDALDALERAREAAGRPFIINSAYRDPLYNARIGGAPMSRHKAGDAFAIALSNHDDRHALEALLRRCGFNAIGRYRTFVHADARGGRDRFWYGKGARQLWNS